MRNKTAYIILSIFLAIVIFYVVIDVLNITAITGYVIAGTIYGIVSYIVSRNKIFK